MKSISCLPILYGTVKLLEVLGVPYKLPVYQTDKSICFTWITPSTTVLEDVALSIYWLTLEKRVVDVSWNLHYRYLNETGYLGYFTPEGDIVLNMDGGISEELKATALSTGIAEPSIVQKTPQFKLSTRDLRNGTLVEFDVKTETSEMLHLMNVEIEYKEHDLQRLKPGRKRKLKIRLDEDDYWQ